MSSVEPVLREATLDDAGRIADLANACSRLEVGRDTMSGEEIRRWMLEESESTTDRWVLIEDADGTLLACGSVNAHAPYLDQWSHGFVHPDARGKGIGTTLLEKVVEAAGSIAERAPAGNTSHVRVWHWESNPKAADLFRAHGFTLARDFYTMEIDLASLPPAPATPEGIEIRPLDPDTEAEAAYRAHREAFADHFAESEVPFDLWKQFVMADENRDFGTFLLAWDGAEAAGICDIRPSPADPNVAVVEDLSVRPAWRRRAIGSALLATGFQAMADRGHSSAILDVDAQNAYNAVAFYERNGMHVKERSPIYELALR